jgi:hypothetical protein
MRWSARLFLMLFTAWTAAGPPLRARQSSPPPDGWDQRGPAEMIDYARAQRLVDCRRRT